MRWIAVSCPLMKLTQLNNRALDMLIALEDMVCTPGCRVRTRQPHCLATLMLTGTAQPV